ncbi:hypothetical protein HBN50_03885 [Halobacteriovorax sp. GB3]|uniref:hypothetical protein n=1 Tax=Halobacteriovorax sp. GB3 TaxID=2719615 RepID=UPI002363029A|nr:hypothetical protein [Halobacteriovorax sp. GB3]MDD0852220.1 hypothetical protein [Halobacteriovorax sp. GB3]
MLSEMVNSLSLGLSQLSSSYLIPFMAGVFVIFFCMKMLIYYIAKTQLKIVKEFEVRVHRHMEGTYEESKAMSFHHLAKFLLNKTWNDYFLMRKKNMRRRFDQTTSFLDRIFFIDSGAMALFEDTIKQTRYIEKESGPNFRSVSSFAFSSNVYFNFLFGVIPAKTANQFLNLLPGLFIVGGIFGTFLGIVKGIPGLKGLDPSNVESAQMVLNHFLDQMAFSMNTSIMGIAFSVFFTIVNSLFSPTRLQADAFEVYSNSLEFLFKNSIASKSSHSREESSKESSDEGWYVDDEIVVPQIPSDEMKRKEREHRAYNRRAKDSSDQHRPEIIILNQEVEVEDKAS